MMQNKVTRGGSSEWGDMTQCAAWFEGRRWTEVVLEGMNFYLTSANNFALDFVVLSRRGVVHIQTVNLQTNVHTRGVEPELKVSTTVLAVLWGCTWAQRTLELNANGQMFKQVILTMATNLVR